MPRDQLCHIDIVLTQTALTKEAALCHYYSIDSKNKYDSVRNWQSINILYCR